MLFLSSFFRRVTCGSCIRSGRGISSRSETASTSNTRTNLRAAKTPPGGEERQLASRTFDKTVFDFATQWATSYTMGYPVLAHCLHCLWNEQFSYITQFRIFFIQWKLDECSCDFLKWCESCRIRGREEESLRTTTVDWDNFLITLLVPFKLTRSNLPG